jgi:hypothetical protein
MKAHDAMFLVWDAEGDKPARLEIVSKPAYIERGLYIRCDFSMGAAFLCWKQIPDSQIMACVLCTGFSIVENYGVPVKDVTKELEKIEGFVEYWNEIGVMTGMR